MSPSIPGDLTALALGESALIRGVRVVRRSLFGFQVAGGKETLDARAAAARLAIAPKGGPVRVEVCFRCAGDGLGRRDRGVCGVCHGGGVQVVAPAGGWAEASPAQVAAAVEQATRASRVAVHPRARETLTALLSVLAPLARLAWPGGARAEGGLRRGIPQEEPATAVPGANAA